MDKDKHDDPHGAAGFRFRVNRLDSHDPHKALNTFSVYFVTYIPHLFLLILDNFKANFGYGSVTIFGFIPNAFKYFSCTSSSGLASFR